MRGLSLDLHLRPGRLSASKYPSISFDMARLLHPLLIPIKYTSSSNQTSLFYSFFLSVHPWDPPWGPHARYSSIRV